ncbi:DinB family protein [Epilithonimonas hungarica]|uniref:DinB superfamily protein n=1 Tax=Epilithonimonas hungarica TaxID=454006 RepID=A0A1G7IFG1_9FLAO|nr:DinB family protein [Epilithonimonas hungarica]SDF11328.1 DinB superfamily protein [Epilithonimonas hungarica]
MKIPTNQLLNELRIITENNIEFAQSLLDQINETLNFRTSEDSWNILECLEHLNFYGKFYLPEIEDRINESRFQAARPDFKSGLLGNYFANMMLPKVKPNKMKTLKISNPIHKLLDRSVIEEFIRQENKMLELLEKAETVDLEKTKTSISISKRIKLKLGDTFRFVIYHNLRHIKQAENILKSIQIGVN